MINKARWVEIQTIIDKVFEHSSRNKETYLRQLCGGETAFFKEIVTLLNAEDKIPQVLNRAAIDLVGPFSSVAPVGPMADLTGSIIGPYRLCKEIGRGGMGVVYLAQREQGPFEQRVAIKLLTVEGNSGLRKARFQREQQLLASLNHPNIAQLYDGGFSDRGQPYIVMELVQGYPINRYCYQRKLGIPERLRLVLQVAGALQYAHQHLIVHRDIKPSNILVTANGQVKLLDFGIAKLLGLPSAPADHKQPTTPNATDLTYTGEQLMTPGYAAPEQLLGGNITIATDIYQLGLILYELLSGHLAYRDLATSFYDLANVICEKKPTLPSIIAETLSKAHIQSNTNSDENTEAGSAIATPTARYADQRGLGQLHWRKALRGDLDAITLKTLENKPNDRYASLEAFKADIQSFFANRPIAARKHNLHYKASKFIRRNLWKVVAASTLAVLMLAYAATVTIQANTIQKALDKTREEALKAQQVSSFLIDIFRASDPFEATSEQLSARELLDRAQRRLLEDAEMAPAIKGHMLQTLGEINHNLGADSISIQLLEKALAQNRQHSLSDSQIIANNLAQLALAYNATGQYQKASAMLEESLSIYESLKRDHNREYLDQTVAIINDLGLVQYQQGNYSQAKRNWNRVVETLNVKTNGIHRELAVALNNLASVYHLEGDYENVTAHMQEAIRINEQVLGKNHPRIGVSLSNLAMRLTDWEFFDQAEPLFQRALAIQQQALGAEHPHSLVTQRNYAVLLHRQRHLHRAEEMLRKTLLLQEKTYGATSVRISTTLLRLGSLLQDLGKYAEADAVYTRLLDIYRAPAVASSVSHSELGRALLGQASLKQANGDLQVAASLYREALNKLPPKGMRTSMAQLGYARVLLDMQSYSETEELALKVLQFRLRRLPEGHSLTAEARVVLGAARLKLDGSELSITLLTTGYHILTQRRGPRDSFTLLAQQSLMDFYGFKDPSQLLAVQPD